MERSFRDICKKVWFVALIVDRFRDKRLTINATTHTFSERSRKKLSKNVWVVALIVNRLSRNRLTIDATTHTFPERSFRDLSEKVIVASIVYRFRDKRKKTPTPKAQLLSWRLWVAQWIRLFDSEKGFDSRILRIFE